MTSLRSRIYSVRSRACCVYLGGTPQRVRSRLRRGSVQADAPLLSDKLAHERGIAGAPTDRQSSSDVSFNLVDLLEQVATGHALDVASLHSVHRREFEQADRFVHVVLMHLCGECHFGEGLGDTNDSLELTGPKEDETSDFAVNLVQILRHLPDSDWNGRSLVVVPLNLLHLLAQGYKV